MTKESLNSSRTPSDGHLADTNPNSAQTLAASCSQPVLTLSQGAPVSDTASSQTLGQNGPVLLQDVDFIEKLAHFDRERIPERVVHAKGSGAFGTFRPYRSMRDYTSAAFLQDPSVSTRFLIRFSTVIGSKGSPDTDRDPRGFAVKFYTSQGNYDVVGLSLPVFFIRDAMQFPDFIHSQKPDPCTNIKNYAHVWDFFSLTPESLHQLMWLYSDRGIVKDFAKMDGFGVNEGIIVMAATNRVDILDPAIMRPGRFDRKVYVGRPDIGGREEILAVHAKNKPLGDDVDLKQIAQTTAGFTGADLENLLNEAAIIAAKENRAYITQNDIKKSFVKVGIGAEKKSRIISDKEKRITAFHEAGHAILFHVLPDVGPVYSVSIIPTGAGAAGYTMPLPEKDEMFNTKGKMLQDITVSLGGRVAEELVFDDITTGASQDIKQATKMAKAMVTRYGMSENVGLICYDNDDDEVFIGRDLAHTRGYGEGVATAIDQEVKRIIDECYAKARQIITENRSVLDACAKLLLEKEKISQKEFEALFETDHVVL